MFKIAQLALRGARGAAPDRSPSPTALGLARIEDPTSPSCQPFGRKRQVAGARTPLHIFQPSPVALGPPCVKRSEMLHSGRLRSGLAWRHSPVVSCHRRWFYLPSTPDPPRPISASRLNGQARSIHYERHPRRRGSAIASVCTRISRKPASATSSSHLAGRFLGPWNRR